MRGEWMICHMLRQEEGERWSVSVKFDIEDMDEDGLEIRRDILYDTLVKATILESEVRIFTLTFTLG